MRREKQQAFIRICHDSGFRLDAVRAAQVAAVMLSCHPLDIWLAMPCWDVMVEIAAGRHPAAHLEQER